MIVRLNKEQQRSFRRQVLNDIVYVISHDALKGMQREGHTALSPVEVFLSAQRFTEMLQSLPNVEEGIDDEIDDLEDEACGDNDAMLIMAVATVLLQAVGRYNSGLDSRIIINRIFEHLDGNELFLPFFNQMAYKEESRWLEGKKTDLLNYELHEIEIEGGGSEEIRQLFEDFIGYSDKMGENSVKELMLFLQKYNIDHNNAYNKEIKEQNEKLGIKSSPIQIVDRKVEEKTVIEHIDNYKPQIESQNISLPIPPMGQQESKQLNDE